MSEAAILHKRYVNRMRLKQKIFLIDKKFRKVKGGDNP